MSQEKIDIEEFLEELVKKIGERFSEQEKDIARLRKEMRALSSGPKSRIDRSVLKVLKGR
jgi:hypothetical protein